MKISKVFYLLSLISFSVFGQKVQLVDLNTNIRVTSIPKEFNYIHNDFNLLESVRISGIRGKVSMLENHSVNQLFNTFWDIANKYGANAFLINRISFDLFDSLEIDISIYNLTDSILNENTKLYPYNLVYVFGDLNRNKDGRKIKFNEDEIVILPWTYISHQNKIGEETTVSIGGYLGSKVWITGEAGKRSRYLSLSGFNVGPGSYNELSIRISTGNIYPVDINFGQFLVDVIDARR